MSLINLMSMLFSQLVTNQKSLAGDQHEHLGWREGLKLYSINQAVSEDEIEAKRALAVFKVDKGSRIVTGEASPSNFVGRILSMGRRIIFLCIAFFAGSGFLPSKASATSHVAEIIAKTSSLGKKEKEAFLVEGAKREGEITIYGSSDVSHFNESMRVFNLRYPFIKSSYLRASRARLVSTVMLEWRSNRNAVDIINSVLHQGFELLAPKGLIQPTSLRSELITTRFFMPRTAHGIRIIRLSGLWSTTRILSNQMKCRKHTTICFSQNGRAD
jgi:hypothetical protein